MIREGDDFVVMNLEGDICTVWHVLDTIVDGDLRGCARCMCMLGNGFYVPGRIVTLDLASATVPKIVIS